ncbi:MAG: dUTP diphosphatase [Treponemataceae bacterium]
MDKRPTIKIQKLSTRAKIPTYGSDGAAGADLSARLDKSVNLAPGERQLIPTGIKMELPPGFEGQVRPRSGLALKKGVTVLNSPGTIDEDYRGEVQIILINHGDHPFVVNDGDRIAQLIIAPVSRAAFSETSELSDSVRSSSGFGSTGV